jgi:hypothetical protein
MATDKADLLAAQRHRVCACGARLDDGRHLIADANRLGRGSAPEMGGIPGHSVDHRSTHTEESDRDQR